MPVLQLKRDPKGEGERSTSIDLREQIAGIQVPRSHFGSKFPIIKEEVPGLATGLGRFPTISERAHGVLGLKRSGVLGGWVRAPVGRKIRAHFA